MSSSFMPSSRLVETVMINVEDFSENFLTCGTCLSGYDQNEHTAKLLPCSHTICRHCIKRIIELQTPRLDHFRCPICRETIPFPPVGGANAFPPAFIVNQLLDLLANQRRDLVPTCQRHPNQELLFCETCDVVFCTDCRGHQHQKQALNHTIDSSNEDNLSIDGANEDNISMRSMHSNNNPCDHQYYNAPMSQSPQMTNSEIHSQILSHNVISFNVAIKRCSEILLYKAHLCVQELNSAQEAVSAELDRLELNTDNTINTIRNSFEKIRNLVNQREKDLLNSVQRLAEDKRKALTDQLAMIQSERLLVRRKCDTIRERIDVRSISRGISYLNDKLDTIASLTEPRENAFLHYDDYRGQYFPSPPSISSNMNILRRQNTVTPSTNQNNISSKKSLGQSTQPDESQPDSSLTTLSRYLSMYGRIIISTTYPALCTIKLPVESLNINLIDKAVIYTVDYHGHPQTSGTFDPIEVYFIGPDDELAPVKLIENSNGSYKILMKPKISGLHKLSVYILQRAMRGSPFQINVRRGQKPKWSLRKGNDINFIQPFALTSNQCLQSLSNTRIYVLDTGNCRTVILNHLDGSYIGSFYGDAFKGQSATGIAFLHPILPSEENLNSSRNWPSPEGALVISNWRQRSVFLVHPISGDILHTITHDNFLEPTSVCVCPATGDILVADNGIGAIFSCHAQIKPNETVVYEIKCLIGNPSTDSPKPEPGNDMNQISSEEPSIRKTYSLQDKHKTLSSSGFGLRRSLIKSRDQNTPSNKTSPSIKRLSLSSIKSSEKLQHSSTSVATLKDGKVDKCPKPVDKSFCKKVNGLCVDLDGSIILASGSLIQIYSSCGKHIKDLTIPNLNENKMTYQNLSKFSSTITHQSQTNTSSLRPHSSIFTTSDNSMNDTSKRHVSMVENYRHSQSIYSTSPNLLNSRYNNTFQSINLSTTSGRRTISTSESSNNNNPINEYNTDSREPYESSTSDLSTQSNRSLNDPENMTKRLDVDNSKPMDKRTRNHSNNQHNGQFYGVAIGRIDSSSNKETIGDCLLASFTDRQKSMIVVWPEGSWRSLETNPGGPTTIVDSPSSTVTPSNKTDVASHFSDSSSPYVLEVDPTLRRSAGIISLNNCRDLVVVDLGASSVHRLRYS